MESHNSVNTHGAPIPLKAMCTFVRSAYLRCSQASNQGLCVILTNRQNSSVLRSWQNVLLLFSNIPS